MKFSASVVAILAACATSVSAGQKVLYPNTTYTWTVGDKATVSWTTTNLLPPTCGENVDTALYLARAGALLRSAGPIAQNFSLLNGQQAITVPNVPAGTYRVVLFSNTSDVRDVGSYGTNFTIKA